MSFLFQWFIIIRVLISHTASLHDGIQWYHFIIDEDLKPIRHRLESREKAIIFVCTFAYRLLSALCWMINSSKSKDVTLSESVFLNKFARVEKLEGNLGKEIEIFFVDVTIDLKKQVAALGMDHLFAGRWFSMG